MDRAKTPSAFFSLILTAVLAPGVWAQTIYVQEGFEDVSPQKLEARGWYDNLWIMVTSAQKYSGAQSVEYRFPAGQPRAIQGGAIRRKFPETDAVYLSFKIKYSSNWTGSNKPWHPHQFHFMTNKNTDYHGPSFSYLTVYVEENEGIPLLAWQDGANIDQTRVHQNLVGVTENRGVAGCNGDTDGYGAGACYIMDPAEGLYYNGKEVRAGAKYFDDAAGPRYKGDWHHIEAYFKLNSIVNGKGQRDGIAQYWYDGQLIIDKRDVVLRTAANPTMKFNQFILAPWIGDLSPIDQTFWVDDIVIANGRAAGGTPPPPPPPPPTTPPPPPAGTPGVVTNLSAAPSGSNSVSLTFTEVADGAGGAAKYDIRYMAGASMNWGTAASVTQGTCASPLAGSAVGASRTCTVTGLTASTQYQFQLVAFRGTMNVDAVFGQLSNSTSATTAAAAPLSVSITQPANQSVVSGIVSVSGTAFDPASQSGVPKIEIQVDRGAFTQIMIPPPPPGPVGPITYFHNLDTRTLSEGMHTVAVRATSFINGAVQNASVQIHVRNAAASTDLNGDGATNVTDVQLVVNRALGIGACGNGDVNGDGACTVVDVQRVVNAALGL